MNYDAKTETELTFFTPAPKYNTLAVSLTGAVQAAVSIRKRFSLAPK